MITAIFADIHANLEAFKAVKADIRAQEYARGERFRKAFLGDVCGYGPNVIECIEDLIGFIDFGHRGNHDEAVLTEPKRFNFYAERAIEYHKAEFKNAGEKGKRFLDFLKSLETHIKSGNLTFVHGSTLDPVKQYILTGYHLHRPEIPDQKKLKGMDHIKYCEAVKLLGDEILFAAHSHESGVYFEGIEEHIPEYCIMKGEWHPVLVRPYFDDERMKSLMPGRHDLHQTIVEIQAEQDLSVAISDMILIPEAKPAVVVVGSVGQPRDRDLRACYVLYDDETRTVEFRRVPYDYDITMEKIEKNSELDDRLGTRLKFGK